MQTLKHDTAIKALFFYFKCVSKYVVGLSLTLSILPQTTVADYLIDIFLLPQTTVSDYLIDIFILPQTTVSDYLIDIFKLFFDQL
jgi:hypothetical protein